jgi:5-enolpyruvylshikimate-3-phosphate synthase
MAFAFALLGLVRPGITVSDPGCVSKSWPDFWEACVEPPHPENRDPA